MARFVSFSNDDYVNAICSRAGGHFASGKNNYSFSFACVHHHVNPSTCVMVGDDYDFDALCHKLVHVAVGKLPLTNLRGQVKIGVTRHGEFPCWRCNLNITFPPFGHRLISGSFTSTIRANSEIGRGATGRRCKCKKSLNSRHVISCRLACHERHVHFALPRCDLAKNRERVFCSKFVLP